ncbi:MAG: hypothetical protein EGP72_01815, partial [Phocaeicola plebeius]|nr:hypothetical protein [Phocaeicola plebeius]
LSGKYNVFFCIFPRFLSRKRKKKKEKEKIRQIAESITCLRKEETWLGNLRLISAEYRGVYAYFLLSFLCFSNGKPMFSLTETYVFLS